MKIKNFSTLLLSLLFLPNLFGVKSAQDNWYLDREIELPEMPGFRKPYGVTIDSVGNAYVTDRDNDSITVWDQDGKFPDEWFSWYWTRSVS